MNATMIISITIAVIVLGFWIYYVWTGDDTLDETLFYIFAGIVAIGLWLNHMRLNIADGSKFFSLATLTSLLLTLFDCIFLFFYGLLVILFPILVLSGNGRKVSEEKTLRTLALVLPFAFLLTFGTVARKFDFIEIVQYVDIIHFAIWLIALIIIRIIEFVKSRKIKKQAKSALTEKTNDIESCIKKQ